MPPTKIDDESFDGSPLSEDERKQLRRLLEEDRRRRWLRKAMLSIAIWVSAIIVGITAISDGAKRALKIILGI